MQDKNLVVNYDTETTGLPVWGKPSGSEEQPHIVRLAAVVAEKDTGNIVFAIDVIVKPEGWVIPEETIAIHGITNEHAKNVGIPEKEAVELLESICDGALRVAYNKPFDQRIIRIAMKRYLSEESIEKWAEKEDHLCTMKMAKDALAVKSVKLVAAHLLIMGFEMGQNHDAMADALASHEIYFKLKK